MVCVRTSARERGDQRPLPLHRGGRSLGPGRPGIQPDHRQPRRLLRYNLQTGRLDRQHLYWTDPIAEPPAPAGSFAVNGLVELLPLNNQFLLSMERSFSVGAPDTGNTIKLYQLKLSGADNINGVDSIAATVDLIRPVNKTLLFDLDDLGIPLDNVEGMAFGPDLPDGRRSLLLVSDNNFTPPGSPSFCSSLSAPADPGRALGRPARGVA